MTDDELQLQQLPKTAQRIINDSRIRSLKKHDIHWVCWAADGWSDAMGCDGYKDGALYAIDGWMRGLRGPDHPKRYRSVFEILSDHINGNQVSDRDLEVLFMYVNEALSKHLALWTPCTERLHSVDGIELDDATRSKYKLADDAEMIDLAAAVIDQVRGNNKACKQLKFARLEIEQAWSVTEDQNMIIEGLIDAEAGVLASQPKTEESDG